MICNKAQKGGGTLAKIIKPIKMIGVTMFCSIFLFGCEERPLKPWCHGRSADAT